MSKKSLVKTTNGITFNQLEGECILDASIEANYPIKHSCRSGRCGFCKVKLLSGNTLSYRHEELTPQELNDNWILSCARTALTDIEIDAGTLTKLETPKVVNIPCSINTLNPMNNDYLIVTLQLPIIVKFNYLAGQFIDITTPEGSCKSYSLATNKVNNQTIELHITKVADEPMSNYWFNQAKVNDLLMLEGPKGTFFIRDNFIQKELYFIALNTGISAIKAMLESIAESIVRLPLSKKPRAITVIWEGVAPEDFYIDLASYLTAKLPQVSFIYTLPTQCKNWLGHVGTAQEVLLKLQPHFKHSTVYVSGSSSMINAIRTLVINNGLPTQQFYENILS